MRHVIFGYRNRSEHEDQLKKLLFKNKYLQYNRHSAPGTEKAAAWRPTRGLALPTSAQHRMRAS